MGGMWRGRGGVLRIQSERIGSTGSYLKCNTCYILSRSIRAGIGEGGVDTLITGEADYPTEVKAKELGINLILGGHRETEVFGVRNLAARNRGQM